MASVLRRSYASLLLVLVLATACGTAGRTPEAAAPSTATAPSVVPWADLPAAHQRIPTTRVPATPDPGPAERAPACPADRLRVTLGDVGPALGTVYWLYKVRSTGGPPCSVAGTPAVVPLTDGAADGVPVRATHDSDGYRHPVLLDRTHTATLRVGWVEDWCTTPVRVDALRVTFGGAAIAAPGLGRSPICNGGNGPTPVMIWPLLPSDHREGSITTAWDRVAVRSPSFAHLTGAPGTTLRFTVTLEAPHDLSLAACPDYEVYLIGNSTRTVERHQLNCAAVPFRRADGTPYLPAGRAVRFAMRVTAPAGPAGKGIWQVVTPTGATGVGGSFTPAPASTATP